MIPKINAACNLSWDGCKTQEKWVGAGGGVGGEGNKVHYGRRASGE